MAHVNVVAALVSPQRTSRQQRRGGGLHHSASEGHTQFLPIPHPASSCVRNSMRGEHLGTKKMPPSRALLRGASVALAPDSDGTRVAVA
ncbi:hypothetical protein MRX96_011328 [Rhipicephalus microplus]